MAGGFVGHNFEWAERKISQKTPEYVLNYSLQCSAVKIWSHFGLYFSSNGQLKKFIFSVTVAILNGGRICRTQFCMGSTQGSSLPGLVQFGSAVSGEKI
jgi:hypothetical protein